MVRTLAAFALRDPMSVPLVVGVDLVSVEDVRESVNTFGDRFLRRVFTDEEIRYCLSRNTAYESFAARFAAKEAVIKALSCVEAGIDWRQIEVVRAPSGACSVRLTGTAAEWARACGVGNLSLSLSHADEYAIAFVVGSSAFEGDEHVESTGS